jgi:hypothetical protein
VLTRITHRYLSHSSSIIHPQSILYRLAISPSLSTRNTTKMSPPIDTEPSIPFNLFFYGSLMDSDVLSYVAKPHLPPIYQKASIKNFAMKLWGPYPTLIPATSTSTATSSSTTITASSPPVFRRSSNLGRARRDEHPYPRQGMGSHIRGAIPPSRRVRDGQVYMLSLRRCAGGKWRKGGQLLDVLLGGGRGECGVGGRCVRVVEVAAGF